MPFILPHRSSQSLPDPHKSLQLPLPHFKDPHRSLQIPTLLPYLKDPTCHRGSSHFIPSPYPIYTSLFPFTDPHISLQLPHRSSQTLTISLPYLIPYYFTYRPGLSFWQVQPSALFQPYLHKFTPLHGISQTLPDPHIFLRLPHRSSQTLTFSLPYLLPYYLSIGPACHCGRSRLSVSPYPIFTPFSHFIPPTVPHRPPQPLTYPHRSFHFLSPIYYPSILSTRLAGYFGKSRFLPSFNSIHTDLLPFIDPYRSS